MARSKTCKKRNKPEKQLMEAAVADVIKNGLSFRAAQQKYNISKSAIERSVKKTRSMPDNVKFEYIPKYDIHRVFTTEQETQLRDYIILAAKHNYGLTRIELRRLAYKFAIANKIAVPQWEAEKSAGQGWLRMFRKRNPVVALRKPEATSLSRATAFNKTNVQEFFEKYKQILQRKEFQPHQIWNVDETGLSTVHVPPKIFASKGAKQVGNMTSGERGTTVTLIAAINAAGNTVPPLFVFPRVHFKPMMLKGAPSGSVGAANRSGWSNEDIFRQFIDHFIDHVKLSKENPHLIILDNHESHYCPKVVNKAKEVGLEILTLPPHCSHKMQPLDRTVFGPFKQFYNKSMNDWMNSPGNAGRPVTIYDVSQIAGIAYEHAFSIKNIVSGFKSTGIVPLNSNIFDDTDFIASSVTDRPLGGNNVELPRVETAESLSHVTSNLNNGPGASCSTNLLTSVANKVGVGADESMNMSVLTSPEMIRPFPKAAPRKKLTRRRVGKSRILTDTPEEMEIKKMKESKKRNTTREMEIRKKQVTKKLWEDSSDDEVNLVLDDESSDFDLENDVMEYEMEKRFEKEDIEESDHVLVQCSGEKNHKEHYVAKIIKSKKQSFDVIYYKKMQKTDTFIIQDEDESQIYDLQPGDIIMKLPAPETAGSTKRSSNHVKFGINFSGYNMR